MDTKYGTKSRLLAILAAVLLSTAGTTALAETKMPAGPDDHVALAKQYREKAETYRTEAKDHREMAEAARKSPLNAHATHGQKNPSIEKMVKLCNGIAAKADALALASEKAADFHELRGKEMKDK